MGQFLCFIEDQQHSLNNVKHDHWKQKLQKLKQYHGIFKSVCENYVVTKDQFAQIFGSTEKMVYWDRKAQGKVQALQLFSGLSFYATDCTFKDKIKFLFNMFDFNQIKSISFIDFQYMILCICNSTYKILQKNAFTSPQEITEWLMKYFSTQQRITITELYRFCLHSEQVQKFLKCSHSVSQEQIDNLESHRQVLPFKVNRAKLRAQNSLQNPENQALMNQQFDWFKRLSQKIVNFGTQNSKNYGCQISWVYGIRTSDIQRPFLIIDHKILYASSSLMILYSIDHNQQSFYSEHQKTVINFCYSKKNQIVASAEIGQSPNVHIWSIRSLENISVLKTYHTKGISLMNFSMHQQMLITVGREKQSPIIIYSIETKEIKYSFHAKTEISQIIVPLLGSFDIDSQMPSANFIGIGKQEAFYFELGQQVKIQCFEYGYSQEIVSTAAIYVSVAAPYLRAFQTPKDVDLLLLTGHANGQIRMLSLKKGASSQIVTRLPLRVQYLKFTEDFIFACSGHLIYVYEFEIFTTEIEPNRIIDLTADQTVKLINNNIKYFDFCQDFIVLMSQGGDFVQIKSQQIIYKNSVYQESERIQRIATLIQFEGQMKSLCIVQRNEDEYILFCVSGNKKILGINNVTHKLEDVWEMSQGQSINVLDAVYSQEGLSYVICGCKSGRLLIRIDWQESPKFYDCGSQIVQLKISKDCSYLLVATADNYIMFFTHLNRNFSSPRKLHFQNQSPICLNFLDNYKFFVVNTTAKNVYLIEIPQLKHKNIHKENQKINISQIQAKFPFFTAQRSLEISHAVLGGDMKYCLMTLPDGRILFYESPKSFNSNSYTILNLHQGSISKLLTTQDQSKFYSLGLNDKILVEWEVSAKKNIKVLPPSFGHEAVVNNQQSEFIRQKQLSCFQTIHANIDSKLTYLFRGTTNEKLNSNITSTLEQEGCFADQVVDRRESTFSLQTKSVYGIECQKKGTVRYINANGNDIVYFTSRFLVKMNTKTKEQQILEPTVSRISCMIIVGDNIFISQASRNPKIYILPNQVLDTTHELGVIHMAVHGNYLLSYGVRSSGYSINLHNFKTKQFLKERVTELQISEFIFLSPTKFVSLNQIRIWQNFNKSQTIGYASSGAILPNKKDICLGGSTGSLAVMNDKGIFVVNEYAHQKQILTIKIKILQQNKFQIITVSADERIKIFDQYFNCKVMINLRENQHFKYYQQKNHEVQPNSLLKVTSLDYCDNKILFGFSFGLLCQVEVQQVRTNIQQPNKALIATQFQFETDKSLSDKHNNQIGSQKYIFQYKKNWRKLIQSYSAVNANSPARTCLISTHPTEPLIASTGKDSYLTIRQTQTDYPIVTYFFEGRTIINLKFSPDGKIIIVGFDNNQIKLYCLMIKWQKNKVICLFQKCLQSFKDHLADITNIVFSPCSNYFAVSYLPQSRDLSSQAQKENLPKVLVYKNKQYKLEISNNQEKYYTKYCQISDMHDDSNKSIKRKCIYSMTFAKNQENQYALIMYQQLVNQQNVRVNTDSKGKCIIYMVEQRILQKQQYPTNFNWLEVELPNLINFSVLLNLKSKQGAKIPQISISAMKRYAQDFIFGDTNGRLHILRKSSLYTDKGFKQYLDSQKCLSKVYASHTSFINQIEISADKKYLFVSGNNDESIVKYYINDRDRLDFDNTNYEANIPDVNHEYLTQEQFYNFMNNIQPIREQIKDILTDVETESEDNICLKTLKIYGRRAYDRRNNIFIDHMNNLVYILGSNIIIQSTESQQRQYSLQADPSPTSYNPQISAFHMNQRYLILATEDEQSSIYIWDIQSKVCVDQMRVDLSIIYHIKLSGERYAILYGINEQFKSYLKIVDWKAKKTEVSYCLLQSACWKIKDLFLYQVKGDKKQFLTCGVEHLAFWEVKGGNLIRNSFQGKYEGITFMVIQSYKNLIITGCQKGRVYIWRDFELLSTIPVQDTTIRSICVQQNLIIVGGMTSIVSMGRIVDDRIQIYDKRDIKDLKGQGQNIMIEGDFDPEFNMQLSKKGKTNVYATEFDVQSIICDRKGQSFYVGTRSGDIYKLSKQHKMDFEQVLWAHDNQIIVSVAFDCDSTKGLFYSLTKSGLIQSWSLTNLDRVFSYNLMKKSKKIFSVEDMLVVCCERGITTISVQGNNMKFVEELSMEFQAVITDCAVSSDNKYIVVSLSHNQTNSIVVYQIKVRFVERYRVGNLKYEIEYLDFSTDQKYVLFKDKFQQLGMLDIISEKRINTIFVEMKIEWESQGIRISPKGQKIYCSYSRENKVTTMAKLDQQHVIVGDQMGTLRIFQYPCPQNRLGQLHTKCYTSHMNYINNVKVDRTRTYVLTTAMYDKSMILWKKIEQQ